MIKWKHVAAFFVALMCLCALASLAGCAHMIEDGSAQDMARKVKKVVDDPFVTALAGTVPLGGVALAGASALLGWFGQIPRLRRKDQVLTEVVDATEELKARLAKSDSASLREWKSVNTVKFNPATEREVQTKRRKLKQDPASRTAKTPAAKATQEVA